MNLQDIVEEIGHGLTRDQLIYKIRKDFGKNYKFEKYSDKQLFAILNRLNNEKESREIIKQPEIDYSGYRQIEEVDDVPVYYNDERDDFMIQGSNIKFETESEAVDYIKSMDESLFDDLADDIDSLGGNTRYL